MDPNVYVIAAIFLSLVLLQVNQRRASPVLAIFNRWLRCGIFAAGGATALLTLELSSRPWWVIAVVMLLVWFLIETVYNWLAISALSLSPLPLFPRFGLNTAGDEWPAAARFLRLRDFLRREGFKQVQALKAELAPGLHLRMNVYQDAAAQVRLQLAFLPHPGGAFGLTCSASSHTADGRRHVTDNLHLPFGGFYPENWVLERRPWTRSLPRLLARHRDRVAKAGQTVVPWTTEPLGDLNDQQSELERINTELGFLLPHREREDHGKISHEGRYRVWKEVLSLNYLGRSMRYE